MNSRSTASLIAAILVAGFTMTAIGATPGVRAVTVAEGVAMGWAVAFLPGGDLLVTERAGTMRRISAGGVLGKPIKGVPAVVFRGQGGLLDLVLDSRFEANRTLYFCYSAGSNAGSANSTALASAKLSADGARLDSVRVIFQQSPMVDSRAHFGCRIVEAPDGNLFLTLGDRFSRMQDAQTLDNHHGKIVRITKDGAAPSDNPFVGRAGALPEIWSLGHRNLQGAALDAESRLWTTEHGAQGGDELNRPQAGLNYGWPVITHGVNYGGGKIGEGINKKAGLEQPVHHWTPSIAPSGLAVLTSDRYGPTWKNSLFAGSLKFNYVARLTIENGKVASVEPVIDLGQRVRDVRQGPDGFLYVLTEAPKGRIVRLERIGGGG